MTTYPGWILVGLTAGVGAFDVTGVSSWGIPFRGSGDLVMLVGSGPRIWHRLVFYLVPREVVHVVVGDFMVVVVVVAIVG